MTHLPTSFRKVLAVACFAAALAVPIPGHAQSGARDCPVFPKVEFWGEMTHESVSRYVAKTHAGDWVAYLNQLQRQYETLANIQDRGKGAIIKRQGRKVRIAGKQLAKYIKVSTQRLSIVACLAEREDASESDLANFSTAAGTPDAGKAGPPLATQRISGVKDLGRTYVTIPEDLLAKLRKAAVRQSLKDTRKVSVNDMIVKILKRKMLQDHR